MAIGHGKDCDVYVNGRNLTAYFTSASPSLTAQAVDSTTMSKSSRTFVPGLKEHRMSLAGFFDGTATVAAAAIFDAVLGAAADSLLVVYPIGESALGDLGYAMRARCVQHDVNAPVEGLVSTSAEFVGDDDVDKAISLHVLGAETSASNSSSVDQTSSSSAGSAAHLHVTEFTGTDITIKVQHSADDAAWADLITFTAATAAGTSERSTSSGTVNRYVRTIWTGTFTTATFNVAFSRK